MLLQALKPLLRPAARDLAARPSLDEQFADLLKTKCLDEAERLLYEGGEDAQDPMRMAMWAELRAHQRRFSDAEALALQALRLRPGLALGHHVLSLIRLAEGRLEEALAQAINAYNLAASEARICAQLGLCHIKLGHYDFAYEVLKQALLLDPEHAPSLNNMAIACHAKGRSDDALYYLQRALTLAPDYEPAQRNLREMFTIAQPAPDAVGAMLQEIEPAAPALPDCVELSQAQVRQLEERFGTDPQDTELAIQLMQHYLRALAVDSAHDVLQIALVHHPRDVSLLSAAAGLWHAVGLRARAESLYRQALEQDPEHLPALRGLAKLLKSAERHEEVLPLLERAAVLDASKETLLALCSAQTHACCYHEALATADRLEAMDEGMRPLLRPYRATAHTYLGHFELARRELSESMQQDPGNLSYRAFDGTLLLMLGDYARGWDGYRLRALIQPERMRLLPYPAWQGEPLRGKEVLILAEQGLGDQVMFASCLPDLLAEGPKAVYLEVEARLAKLFRRSFPEVEVYASDQHGFEWLPAAAKPDYYLPIADLAWRYRRAERDFPHKPGYLQPDPARVAHWRARLDTLGPGPKIGFTWRGGVQQTRRAIRSLELAQLLPLLEDPRFRFVNLQYGPVEGELAAFSATHALQLANWPEAIADLDEFAALISALDLVITVCNTTVHFAGALDRPCWVLTPYVPEWRYGVQRPDMPWYPSVQLIRQRAFGDWQTLLAEVKARLDSAALSFAGSGTECA